MKEIEFLVASKELMRFHINTLIALEKDSQLSKTWDKSNFLIDLDLKWTLSTLLFYKNILIGFAIISKKTEASCHIHRYIISSAYRRNGFGSLLLTHLKSIVYENFDYLTLMVDAHNTSAISFYKKHFFNPIWSFETDILMVCKTGNKIC